MSDPKKDKDLERGEEFLEAFGAGGVVEDPGHPVGDDESPADDTEAPPP